MGALTWLILHYLHVNSLNSVIPTYGTPVESVLGDSASASTEQYFTESFLDSLPSPQLACTCSKWLKHSNMHDDSC